MHCVVQKEQTRAWSGLLSETISSLQGQTDCLEHQNRMSVLICVTLLFVIGGTYAKTGTYILCIVIVILLWDIWNHSKCISKFLNSLF